MSVAKGAAGQGIGIHGLEELAGISMGLKLLRRVLGALRPREGGRGLLSRPRSGVVSHTGLLHSTRWDDMLETTARSWCRPIHIQAEGRRACPLLSLGPYGSKRFERPQSNLVLCSFNKYLLKIGHVPDIAPLIFWTGKQVQRAKETSPRLQSELVVKMGTVLGSSMGICPSLALPCLSLSHIVYEIWPLAQSFPMCVLRNTRPKMVSKIRVPRSHKFGKPFWKGWMHKTILRALQVLTVKRRV